MRFDDGKRLPKYGVVKEVWDGYEARINTDPRG
jgi:hypothetical protein